MLRLNCLARSTYIITVVIRTANGIMESLMVLDWGRQAVAVSSTRGFGSDYLIVARIWSKRSTAW